MLPIRAGAGFDTRSTFNTTQHRSKTMTSNRKSMRVAMAMLASAFLAPSVSADSRDELVRRGAQLVGIGGCMDCHTPFKMGPKGPEKDLRRGLSGHPEELRLAAPPRLDAQWNWVGTATMTAFAGPWGRSYAANLTPDRETGIGAWREQDFIQAMRTGRHLGVARPIAPPMPWQALAGLPDRDLRAIYRYLMAQPAVRNKVPDYLPPVATARAGE
jgi:mono/diheme cytochrome c family protein